MMFLNYITGFETVQFVFIIGFFVAICMAMGLRRSRQSEELKSQDQRQKDLIPISQRISNHKAREKEAGHQLARDF